MWLQLMFPFKFYMLKHICYVASICSPKYIYHIYWKLHPFTLSVNGCMFIIVYFWRTNMACSRHICMFLKVTTLKRHILWYSCADYIHTTYSQNKDLWEHTFPFRFDYTYIFMCPWTILQYIFVVRKSCSCSIGPFYNIFSFAIYNGKYTGGHCAL